MHSEISCPGVTRTLLLPGQGTHKVQLVVEKPRFENDEVWMCRCGIFGAGDDLELDLGGYDSLQAFQLALVGLRKTVVEAGLVLQWLDEIVSDGGMPFHINVAYASEFGDMLVREVELEVSRRLGSNKSRVELVKSCNSSIKDPLATRELQLQSTDEVVATAILGLPYFDKQIWKCDFQLSGIAHAEVFVSSGIDGLQACTSALAGLRSLILNSELPLYWARSSRCIEISGIPYAIPRELGLDFVKEVENRIEAQAIQDLAEAMKRRKGPKA